MNSEKVITTVDAIYELAKVCRVPNCGSVVDRENIKAIRIGGLLRLKCLCNNHHQFEWDSSPMLGSGPSAIASINVLLSSFCLTIGLHIQQVSNIM